MCGIIYRKSLQQRNIGMDMLHLYKNQKERGTQGFGYFTPNNNYLYHTPDHAQIIKKLKSITTNEMLFHHRIPTSTINTLTACHPFDIDIDGTSYIVVHNGYLSNEDQLKKQHEKLGYKYTSVQPDGTFNDSESLAIDIALTLSGKQKKLKAKGAIAFIAISKGIVFFARNSESPLYYHINEKNITIRSKGRGYPIKTDTLYKLENNKLTTRPLKIPEYEYETLWKPNPPTTQQRYLSVYSQKHIADKINEYEILVYDALENPKLYTEQETRTNTNLLNYYYNYYNDMKLEFDY